MVLKRLYICLYFFLNTDFIFKFFYKLFNNKMIVICRTIMKYCRIFFWCLRIQIAKITSSSSIFTSKMIMISNFFITSTKFVFALCDKLFGFNVIFLYLSMISFLFFHSLLFSLLDLLHLCKTFWCWLYLYINQAYFLLYQMNNMWTSNR